MYLVYDTETTGPPNETKPFDHICQPHIVQLAAQLYDAMIDVQACARVYRYLNSMEKKDARDR